MPKIIADIRDGSLISQHPDREVERLLGRQLDWEEVPDTRRSAGSYYQCDVFGYITPEEAEILSESEIENISVLKEE